MKQVWMVYRKNGNVTLAWGKITVDEGEMARFTYCTVNAGSHTNNITLDFDAMKATDMAWLQKKKDERKLDRTGIDKVLGPGDMVTYENEEWVILSKTLNSGFTCANTVRDLPLKNLQTKERASVNPS